MRRWPALIELVLDAALAYTRTPKPRKRVLAFDVVFIGLACVLLVTAVGFSLAAAFWALRSALGGPVAGVLTATIALAGSAICFLASRVIVGRRNEPRS